ncbi:MAG: AMP-binding protein, partial [Rhodospirillales bacterium]|nr:AMP-binding protein [Rhodospirillales bacterium]
LTLWVPTMLALLVDHRAKGNYDLSSLKKIWYGSSPISRRVLDASMKLFDAGFYQFYGQTESGMNSVLRPEDHAERSQFTGREMVGAELRIVDDNGDDVVEGVVGEVIIAQMPLGMIGYYGNEAATSEVIRDGWIYSGDLARIEGGGYFTIIDRKRDMIISGAENIYSKEVEDIIAGHPAVREVSVFGIPHDTYGESVCAAVVLQDGQRVTEDEIIAFCEQKFSRYKRPRAVEFHDELPKNASGKVTKNVLREPHWMEEAKRV